MCYFDAFIIITPSQVETRIIIPNEITNKSERRKKDALLGKKLHNEVIAVDDFKQKKSEAL